MNLLAFLVVTLLTILARSEVFLSVNTSKSHLRSRGQQPHYLPLAIVCDGGQYTRIVSSVSLPICLDLTRWCDMGRCIQQGLLHRKLFGPSEMPNQSPTFWSK